MDLFPLSRIPWKMKIVTTAVFSVLLLGRTFHLRQWGAIALIELGVALASLASVPYHEEGIMLYNVGAVIVLLKVTTTRIPTL